MTDFELLLIRHGVAQEWSPNGDAERSLTPEGQTQIARSVAGLETLGLDFDRAMASPYLRARQTATAHCARLLRDSLGDVDFEIWPGLVPSAPADATLAEILARGSQLRDGMRLAVFGHNPNLSTVISLLFAGHAGAMVNLRPGDVAHFWVPSVPLSRSQGPRGVLTAFYPREHLERLAQG